MFPAAGAAAKLEKFAHIPSQSPGKSNQIPPGKGPTGGSGDRKSLGKVADNSAANPKIATKKSPVKGHSGATMDDIHNVNIAGPQEPTLNEVMGAINACSSSVSEMCVELRGLKEEVSSIRQEIQKVVERISGLEERVSRTEDMVAPMQQDFKRMQAQLETIKLKMDEWENRSRRQNIRVLGLPEKCEGPRPEEFMEGWLKEVFGAETFSQLFSIERAHRVPTNPIHAERRTRPLIMRFFNFKDKMKVLQRAREKGDIFYNGARISFYPDYSPELQRRRAGFLDIKRALRNLNIPYALLYPARLRVVASGSTQFFESARGAMEWLEEHKKNC